MPVSLTEIGTYKHALTAHRRCHFPVQVPLCRTVLARDTIPTKTLSEKVGGAKLLPEVDNAQ